MRFSTPTLRTAARMAALAAVFALAPAAHAQDCDLPDDSVPFPVGNVCNVRPVIEVTPPGGAVSQTDVAVSVTATDHFNGNDFESFRILLDGTDVTPQWNVTYTDAGAGTGLRRTFRARGTVTLSDSLGERTLVVRMADTSAEVEETRTWKLMRPGVQVGPDGAALVEPPAVSRTTDFTVTNTGVATATFALAAGCRDALGQPVTPCSLSAASRTLGPKAAGTVTATYPAYGEGGLVTVTVRARQTDAPGVEDAGWTDVAIRSWGGSAAVAPQVALVPLNAGAGVERGQCITVATARRGAYECGDLRIAHGLPVHRTRSRGWAPALLYNSQHAHPRPTVYADVTLPAHSLMPGTVEMVVTMANGGVHRATFAGTGFLPGSARRIGVQWDAAQTGTGLYGYTVQVVSHFSSNPVSSAVHAGEIAIVNRADAYFGAGWWLAGLERLYCVPRTGGGCRTLWVGGDGSTRVYEPAASGPGGRWVAQRSDRGADTIVLADSGYVRQLPGGGEVYFDVAGRQYKTVNRLGQTTRFVYGTHGLTGIYAPGTGPGGPGTGDPAWALNWDNAAVLVRSITATLQGAPARTTSLTIDGTRRVTAIAGPDTGSVRFEYDATFTRRVKRQRDRRGTWTEYGYDAAGKLASARVLVGTAANGAVDPVTVFAAAESRGVAAEGAAGAAPAVAAQAYTRIDGPRTDVDDHATLWLTATGAVRRVRDALGAETFVQHGDPRFPALATRVQSNTGIVSTATYDPRGRAVSTTVAGAYGGGETSTTTSTWDDACDRPAASKAPGADTVFTGYDPVTCNVQWQRQGRDPERTVNYAYHPAGHPQAGQLESVTGPRDAQGQRAVERVAYDARGNVRTTLSPLGFLTLYRRDALGRDSIVYTPVADDATARDTVLLTMHGARQEIRYDALDRVRETIAHGPRIHHGTVDLDSTSAESLSVATILDGEGLPLWVTRTVSPNPSGLQPQVAEYRYDGAGRKTDEWTTPLIRHQYGYDLAGNVTTHTNPRLGVTTTRYDVLNRPVRRQVPAAYWAGTGGSCPPADIQEAPPGMQISCERMVFPFHPNQGTGYTVPEEVTLYRYDAAGNMRYAENAAAVVQRTYHPNGQLRGDTLFIRDPSTGAMEGYGLRYDYDTSTGQMLRLHHPGTLAESAAAADTFRYDPATALLTGVTDRLGNAFSFVHDKTGRLSAMGMPGGITDTRVYDVEGRLKTRRTMAPAHGTTPLQDEAYTYDARDKVRHVATGPTVNRSASTTYTQWYSGLGNLVMTDWDNVDDPQWQRERFGVDPLGNLIRKHTFEPGTENPGNDHPDYAYTLHPVQGHVTDVRLVDVTTHPAGTVGGPRDETRYTYDAAGNQETSWQRVDALNAATGAFGMTRMVDSRSYHGHDGKLHAFQQYSESFASNPPKGSGLWEEYRYDPLGRRIMVTTRRPPELCNVPGATCFGSVTRLVWSGDQLLWELKSADGPYAAEAGGTVSYTHGGGIDRPLAITRSGVGSIIPHENWRGQMARGTYGAGTGKPLGTSSDCTAYPPVNCVPVPWPGWNTSAWHEDAARPELAGTEHYWLGSLAVGMRDASGQLYKRNRYYDPAKGQFTQPDPIGLAGGMNVYGFAAGDPVSYDDPYGLCPESATEGSVCIDLFISKPKEMGFKGDNRGFDRNASPDQSRVQVVASANGDITLEHVSPSCGPVHCAAPYAEGLASNNISSVKHGDGSFTVNITAYNSASFSLAPAIDASVTFHPDGNGGFTTSGRRDQMPSMGIYQRSGGQWNELRRSPEKGGLYLYWFAKDEVW